MDQLRDLKVLSNDQYYGGERGRKEEEDGEKLSKLLDLLSISFSLSFFLSVSLKVCCNNDEDQKCSERKE